MERPERQRPAGKSPGPYRAIFLAAVVLLLFVLIAYLAGAAAARRYEGFLSGYWVGDPGFLQQARLKDLQLFIAPPEGGTRQGYLLMTDLDGNFVSNRAIELRVRSGPWWWAALGAALRRERDAYTATRVEVEYDGAAEAPMPDEMKLTLSMLDGTLTLYDHSRVFAFCTKDLTASAAAVEAYAAD